VDDDTRDKLIDLYTQHGDDLTSPGRRRRIPAPDGCSGGR